MELERKAGFKSKLRYRHALKGFSAQLSSSQVRELEGDPAVVSVTPDQVVHAVATDPLAPGERTPTGVERIRAASEDFSTANKASSANVAVIDTGIDLGHPDLNVVNGTNCVTPGAPAQDDDGHGTHVSGTIGAKNTGSGVVGVAPATKLYAVKVFPEGTSLTSRIICGIDWVAANARALNIKVANMSLGFRSSLNENSPCGSTTPLHQAICNLTAVGVQSVVAAGNEAEAYEYDSAGAPFVPAVYPEALTVTAMADGDGEAGGLAGPVCGVGDDRYVPEYNYAATSAGQAHTLAGPGRCIESTGLGGGRATSSGTSMATPHVAGALALCDGEAGAAPGPCAGLTRPSDLIPKIISLRSECGFVGDRHVPVAGRYHGYLVSAGSQPCVSTTH